MRKLKKTLLLLAGVALFAQAAQAETVEFSTEGYNRIVFPVPYAKIVFTPDSPVDGPIVPLAEKRSLLIRLEKSSRPAQAFVQLVTGEAFPLTLKAVAGLAPQTWRYKQAPDAIAHDRHVFGRPDDRWMVETLFAALGGSTPEGFDPANVGHMAVGGSLSARPTASYIAPGYRLNAYRLESQMLLPIRERDFYREGVVAIFLESDVVSPAHQPHLLVLERTDD